MTPHNPDFPSMNDKDLEEENIIETQNPKEDEKTLLNKYLININFHANQIIFYQNLIKNLLELKK